MMLYNRIDQDMTSHSTVNIPQLIRDYGNIASKSTLNNCNIITHYSKLSLLDNP